MVSRRAPAASAALSLAIVASLAAGCTLSGTVNPPLTFSDSGLVIDQGWSWSRGGRASFLQAYNPAYVIVSGTLRNRSPRHYRRLELWASLYAGDRFVASESAHFTEVGPGETRPFRIVVYVPNQDITGIRFSVEHR